jgi:hypothetical protein
MIYLITFKIYRDSGEETATYQSRSHNRLVATLNARTQAMRDFKADLYDVRLMDVKEAPAQSSAGNLHPVFENILKPFKPGRSA